MLAPDVNVLIYAHRAGAPDYPRYKAWLAEVVGRAEPFAITALVAVGFARVMTYRAPRPTPEPIEGVLAAIDSLVQLPNCRFITPGPSHWLLVSDLCRKTGATGKLVADAAHAAVAIEHGCTFVTSDGDFAAFEPHGLRWQHLVFD